MAMVGAWFRLEVASFSLRGDVQVFPQSREDENITSLVTSPGANLIHDM